MLFRFCVIADTPVNLRDLILVLRLIGLEARRGLELGARGIKLAERGERLA